MKNSNEDSKPASEISEYLREAKNELHQKQQLFIAQKSYTDALDNVLTADASSPEAEEARRHLEESKISLENLVQLVNGTSLTAPS